jgi:hypothetical protein
MKVINEILLVHGGGSEARDTHRGHCTDNSLYTMSNGVTKSRCNGTDNWNVCDGTPYVRDGV